MRKLSKWVLVVVFWVAVGCGSDESTGPTQVTCTGASCDCAANQTCSFSNDSCGPSSCSLTCREASSCTGSCGESCSIECGAQASCTVTLGASGSVSCNEGSVCDVTCTDTCSISCAPGADCRLRCPGETEARTVAGSGSC